MTQVELFFTLLSFVMVLVGFFAYPSAWSIVLCYGGIVLFAGAVFYAVHNSTKERKCVTVVVQTVSPSQPTPAHLKESTNEN